METNSEDYQLFLGPKNSARYLRTFSSIGQGERAHWHWASAFVTGLWMLYRRMYLWGFIMYPLLALLGQLGLGYIMWVATGSKADDFGDWANVARWFVLACSFVVMGCYSDLLYYKHATSYIARSRTLAQAKGWDETKRREWLKKRGGTSLLVLALLAVALAGIVAAVVIPLFAGGSPYADLQKAYRTTAPGSESATITDSHTLIMTSTKHRGAFSYEDMFSVALSPDSVTLWTGGAESLFYRPIRIPVSAISGCSTKCFGHGHFHADILLGGDGVDLGVENSQEVLDWCWKTGLPMISNKLYSAWMYERKDLPSRAGYVQVSKEEYERETESRCMGE